MEVPRAVKNDELMEVEEGEPPAMEYEASNEDVEFRRVLNEMGLEVEDVNQGSDCMFDSLLRGFIRQGIPGPNSISEMRVRIALGLLQHQNHPSVRPYFEGEGAPLVEHEAAAIAHGPRGGKLCLLIASLIWNVRIVVVTFPIHYHFFQHDQVDLSIAPICLSFHYGNHFNYLRDALLDDLLDPTPGEEAAFDVCGSSPTPTGANCTSSNLASESALRNHCSSRSENRATKTIGTKHPPSSSPSTTKETKADNKEHQFRCIICNVPFETVWHLMFHQKLLHDRQDQGSMKSTTATGSKNDGNVAAVSNDVEMYDASKNEDMGSSTIQSDGGIIDIVDVQGSSKNDESLNGTAKEEKSSNVKTKSDNKEAFDWKCSLV